MFWDIRRLILFAGVGNFIDTRYGGGKLFSQVAVVVCCTTAFWQVRKLLLDGFQFFFNFSVVITPAAAATTATAAKSVADTSMFIKCLQCKKFHFAPIKFGLIDVIQNHTAPDVAMNNFAVAD